MFQLSLRGVEVLDEKQASYDDQELLVRCQIQQRIIILVYIQLEIFELRDQIGAVSDFYNASAILQKIKSEVAQYEQEFGEHLGANDMAAATKCAIRLKYYSKAAEEIAAKIDKLNIHQ